MQCSMLNICIKYSICNPFKLGFLHKRVITCYHHIYKNTKDPTDPKMNPCSQTRVLRLTC